MIENSEFQSIYFLVSAARYNMIVMRKYRKKSVDNIEKFKKVLIVPIFSIPIAHVTSHTEKYRKYRYSKKSIVLSTHPGCDTNDTIGRMLMLIRELSNFERGFSRNKLEDAFNPDSGDPFEIWKS